MKSALKTLLLSLSFAILGMQIPLQAEDSFSDHQARILRSEGSVKILKSGGVLWENVHPGTLIEAGDEILTGSESYTDIAYDSQSSNLLRIENNAQLSFKNIEPTTLELKDGIILNALDQLKDTSYQVFTLVASVSAQGTHFEIGYDPAVGMMQAAVIPDQNNTVSRIRVLQEGKDAIILEEGKQVDIEAHQISEVKDIDPSRVERNQENLKLMKEPLIEKEEDDQNKNFSDGNNLDDPGGEEKQNETLPDTNLKRERHAQLDEVVDELIAPTEAWPPQVPDRLLAANERAASVHHDVLSKIVDNSDDLARQIPLEDPSFESRTSSSQAANTARTSP